MVHLRLIENVEEDHDIKKINLGAFAEETTNKCCLQIVKDRDLVDFICWYYL